jgi:Domain of unknown function (DUF1905)
MATKEEAIKVQFTAQLQKSPAKGGWNYVIWPEWATFFKTRGLVKVRGSIDGHPFRSAFMAMGGGVHKLPVKAETRQLLGKQTDDVVTVRLMARSGGDAWLRCPQTHGRPGLSHTPRMLSCDQQTSIVNGSR